MEQSKFIYQKLELFIKKFYTNELIRGMIFFVGLGLLYFLFTLFVEYFLWLKPMGRTVLFWTFIGVEAFLLLRYILFPTFKLLKIQKGIDYKDKLTLEEEKSKENAEYIKTPNKFKSKPKLPKYFNPIKDRIKFGQCPNS